jgi:hypothetical protein
MLHTIPPVSTIPPMLQVHSLSVYSVRLLAALSNTFKVATFQLTMKAAIVTFTTQ